MAYSQFIANYFSSRKPNAWAFLSFAAEFARQYPIITFGEANSRFLNALQKIAASPSSSAPARSKAQSLIDTLKNKSVSSPTSLLFFTLDHTSVGMQTSIYWDPRRDAPEAVGQPSGLLHCGPEPAYLTLDNPCATPRRQSDGMG